MKIKIELPWKDFKDLADEMYGLSSGETYGFSGKYRKHKIENGQYYISCNTVEAYDHDEQKLTRTGKVQILIESINNEI